MSKTSSMSTLKKVLRYMKKYIPLLVISIFLALVTVAMTLYFLNDPPKMVHRSTY